MSLKFAPLLASVALWAWGSGSLEAAGPPETVHVTYHVRDGKLDELLEVLKQHYPTCRRLGLVLADPHVILSGKEEGGKPVVIEILRWKDADAPDSVREHFPDVQRIWDQLNALTEKRGDKRGIEIDEMDVVVGPGSAAVPKRKAAGG